MSRDEGDPIKTRFLLYLLAALASTLVSCGDDDVAPGGGSTQTIDGSVVVPSAWAGEWRAVLEFRDCESGDVVVVEDVVDILCSGDAVVLELAPMLAVCEGSISDTQLTITCGHTFTAASCTVSLDFEATITRDGDAATGSATWSATAEGDCEPLYRAGCEDVTVTMTRLDRNPDCTSSTAMRPGLLSRILARTGGVQ